VTRTATTSRRCTTDERSLPDDVEPRPQHDGESDKERVNRELIELLNELRVALPGVQVLFAFLLTLPFTAGFDRLSDANRNSYFTAVVLTALSSTFLIAPSAHHRLRFRSRAKEQLLKAASIYAIVGLAFLALAMAATLFLITDVVYHSALAAATAGGIGAFTIVFWFAVPRLYRANGSDS
jgi:Kef-type K+ transport system membrane component KefB